MAGVSGPILLAAGGTGGHLFPAEALAESLTARGAAVALVTDERVERLSGRFPAGDTHVITSGTVTGSGLFGKVTGAIRLVLGTRQALRLLDRLRPAAIVGFGGYPTVPPVYAGTMRRIPTVIHEQNAVMGRANRFLAPRVGTIATGFPLAESRFPDKTKVTGNPVRPAVLAAAAATPYLAPSGREPVRLLVTGGSQGARIMSDVVPSALTGLRPDIRERLRVVQQARPEDVVRVREHYRHHGIAAEVESFFADLPARIADAHLVIARAGASTVAELAVIGRPSVLVPLPGSLDQDQAANAAILVGAGAATMQRQDVFTPAWLGREVETWITTPARLAAAAQAAGTVATRDAAERLADLVLAVARPAPAA